MNTEDAHCGVFQNRFWIVEAKDFKMANSESEVNFSLISIKKDELSISELQFKSVLICDLPVIPMLSIGQSD